MTFNRKSVHSRQPLFSVVILQYRQRNYWQETVQSVLEQDYPRIQLIVSDDGTPGFPKRLVETYIREHQKRNVEDVVVRSSVVNGGTAANCDAALACCRGDYILFLDGDDTLYAPDVLTRFAAEFAALPPEERVVSANGYDCDTELNPLRLCLDPEKFAEENRLTADAQYRKMYQDFWPIPSSTAYRRELFDLCGGFQAPYVRLCQDGYFFPHITRLGQHIHGADFIACCHRAGGVANPTDGTLSASALALKIEFLRIAEFEIFPHCGRFTQAERDALCYRYYENLIGYRMATNDVALGISEPAYSILKEWAERKDIPWYFAKSKLRFFPEDQLWRPGCNAPVQLAADENQCCGCTACQNICPQNAISMRENEKGFLYPVIQAELCVRCGRCQAVCPMQGKGSQPLEPTGYFAVKHRDDAIRRRSRSGGVFMALASQVIRQGGAVYGAAFDQDLTVRHIRVDREEDLPRLQGSKYVQSALGDAFAQVEQDLARGRAVLFSGTPCQADGLARYLDIRGTDRERLCLLDIVCHGTPSPKIYREYCDYVERQHRNNLIAFDFRDKAAGWRAHRESMAFLEDGAVKTVTSDTLASLFYQHTTLRETCYRCPHSCYERVSDLTIADFWGIEKALPDFEDDKGVSLVMPHTARGEALFRAVQEQLTVQPVDKEATRQPNLTGPTPKGEQHDAFWQDTLRCGPDACVKKYVYGEVPPVPSDPPIRSVGILTFHRAHNYGAMLQAWALMRVLDNAGYDARIIDYRCPVVEHLYEFWPWQITPRWQDFYAPGQFQASLKAYLTVYRQVWPAFPVWWRRRRNFQAFLRRRLGVHGAGKRRLDTVQCDAVICGSDQIWTKQDPPYYAAFETTARRIAYAPSIGNETFPPEMHPTICEWIKKFDFLSAREAYLAEYLHAIFGVPVPPVTLDPTLLLTSEDYRELIPFKASDQPFVFVYAVLNDDHMVALAEELAGRMNCRLIVLREMLRTDVRQKQDAEASPEKFLWYIRHAACVLTNSFHGTVFSLLFHTPFYGVYPEGGNTRIENLLEIAGLPERHVTETLTDTPISWAEVDARLEKARESSLEFLFRALS